ncbi:MAG: SRPBCC family protein [Fimbriimonas sp.]
MSEYGTIVGPRDVELRRVLPGPIERVWAYLTDSAKRGTWLGTGKMDLRVGGRVELVFRHANLSSQPAPTPERFRHVSEGTSLYGRITRCQPPYALSYTWGGEHEESSEVSFDLTPQGDEVLLVLTHRRLANRPEMSNVATGWHTHLQFLADALQGATTPSFWTRFLSNEQEYERRFGGG